MNISLRPLHSTTTSTYSTEYAATMAAAKLESRAAAPLYTPMTVTRPLKQLWNDSVAILGERFRGSCHRMQVVFNLTSLPAVATAASISTYMDALPTAYILSGSDIVPVEPVPTTLVKRSGSGKDRGVTVICRIEGEEIVAIILSPFLPIISLPLAGAAYAQAKAEAKAEDKAEAKASHQDSGAAGQPGSWGSARASFPKILCCFLGCRWIILRTT